MKRCEHIFHLYDEDESGAFDKEEFKTLWGVLRFNSSQNTKAMRRSVKREGRNVTHVSVLCRQVSNDEIDRVFQRFDMDRDGLLNMTEFINCIKRELSRKTGTRREEIFTLLERGMDGGKKFMEKARYCVRGDQQKAYFDYNPTKVYVPIAFHDSFYMLIALSAKLGECGYYR